MGRAINLVAHVLDKWAAEDSKGIRRHELDTQIEQAIARFEAEEELAAGKRALDDPRPYWWRPGDEVADVGAVGHLIAAYQQAHPDEQLSYADA